MDEAGGHRRRAPRQIRAFHDELFPDGGSGLSTSGGLDGLALGLVMDLVLEPAFKAARERWRRRRDPPLSTDVAPGPGEARTTVSWTWERMLPDGDAVGPVVICGYLYGQDEPVTVEEWPQWIKRSQAPAFAKEHGFVFVPQDLPDE